LWIAQLRRAQFGEPLGRGRARRAIGLEIAQPIESRREQPVIARLGTEAGESARGAKDRLLFPPPRAPPFARRARLLGVADVEMQIADLATDPRTEPLILRPAPGPRQHARGVWPSIQGSGQGPVPLTGLLIGRIGDHDRLAQREGALQVAKAVEQE